MEIRRYTGIRNNLSEERFRAGDLISAANVDLDNTGKPLSRLGFSLEVDDSAYHSIFSMNGTTFVGRGTRLCRYTPPSSISDIANLISTNPVSYEHLVNKIYMSNGSVNLVAEGGSVRKWGIDVPVQQPLANATAGGLRPGRYLYAMTFGCADGQESGTGASGSIELTATGGIAFVGMQVSDDPRVDRKTVYVTAPYGEALIASLVVDNALETAVLTDLIAGHVLDKQFCGPPPAGSIVRYHAGHMYVVAGEYSYFSREYDPELFYRLGTYLRFPGEVMMFEPVADGIFVATAEDTWFLSGKQPGAFTSVHKFPYGAIRGTSVRVIAGDIESPFQGEIEGQRSGDGVLWTSSQGICGGFDGGEAKNYTQAKYGFPSADRGASLLRKDRGYISFVTTLQGVSPAENVYSRG